jgi:hypothetical protein
MFRRDGLRDGFSDDDKWFEASFPWGWIELCVKGNHIVYGGGIGKQVHCPICQPEYRHHDRNIWNQPSESCPASCSPSDETGLPP